MSSTSHKAHCQRCQQSQTAFLVWPLNFTKSYFSTADLTSRHSGARTRACLIMAGITHTEHFLHWIKAAKVAKSFPLCYFFTQEIATKTLNEQREHLSPDLVCSLREKWKTWYLREIQSRLTQHLHPVAISEKTFDFQTRAQPSRSACRTRLLSHRAVAVWGLRSPVSAFRRNRNQISCWFRLNFK